MRTILLGLELIHTVLEKPKPSLVNKKAFVDVIKTTLCDGLLRFSVSKEREVFQLVCAIFFDLF